MFKTLFPREKAFASETSSQVHSRGKQWVSCTHITIWHVLFDLCDNVHLSHPRGWMLGAFGDKLSPLPSLNSLLSSSLCPQRPAVSWKRGLLDSSHRPPQILFPNTQEEEQSASAVCTMSTHCVAITVNWTERPVKVNAKVEKKHAEARGSPCKLCSGAPWQGPPGELSGRSGDCL